MELHFTDPFPRGAGIRGYLEGAGEARAGDQRGNHGGVRDDRRGESASNHGKRFSPSVL